MTNRERPVISGELLVEAILNSKNPWAASAAAIIREDPRTEWALRREPTPRWAKTIQLKYSLAIGRGVSTNGLDEFVSSLERADGHVYAIGVHTPTAVYLLAIDRTRTELVGILQTILGSPPRSGAGFK